MKYPNVYGSILLACVMVCVSCHGLTTIKKPKRPAVTKIGYLKIDGEINNVSHLIEKLHIFLRTKDIKGLLIAIDSPGGCVGSSEALYKEIKKFSHKKPVVFWIENTCCSGGYMAALAANKIVSTENALVGSIGVASYHERFSDDITYKTGSLSGKVVVEDLSFGKFKGIGSPYKAMSEEERDIIQGISHSMYDYFCNLVATERNLSRSNEKVWAEGRVFTGGEAMKLKLIDRVGSWTDARDELISLLKQSGVVIGKEIQCVEPSADDHPVKLPFNFHKSLTIS